MPDPLSAEMFGDLKWAEIAALSAPALDVEALIEAKLAGRMQQKAATEARIAEVMQEDLMTAAMPTRYSPAVWSRISRHLHRACGHRE